MSGLFGFIFFLLVNFVVHDFVVVIDDDDGPVGDNFCGFRKGPRS